MKDGRGRECAWIPQTAYYGGFAKFIDPALIQPGDEIVENSLHGTIERWTIQQLAIHRPRYLQPFMDSVRTAYEKELILVRQGQDVAFSRYPRWHQYNSDFEDEFSQACIRYWVKLCEIYNRERFDYSNRVYSDSPFAGCLKYVLAAELSVTHALSRGMQRRYCLANGVPYPIENAALFKPLDRARA
jgi:hypothetical protein